MKKIIAIVIITTVGVFAAACGNSKTTNTANTTSNNTANANANASNSMREGDHRGNMMNGNHSQMGNQQMEKGNERRQR
jgi:hypothetical protein